MNRPLLAEERECSKQGLIVYMKYTFTLHPWRINPNIDRFPIVSIRLYFL